MPALAIELNDAGLRVAREGHATLLSIDGARDSSPGVAILDGRELTTGWAAVAQASLRPLAADSRFWDRLGIDPVDPRHGGSPNRAEVAFEHLAAVVRAVREPGDVLVLAVPPTYDRTQLGLLLSMVQELELPIAGFVPIPIAVESDPELDDRVLLVDLSMHRSTLTVLDRGERVTATRSRSVPDVGLHAFTRQWVRAIGGEFLRATRFDPLHDAGSEQRLLDRLPEVLDTIAGGGSLDLELPAGSTTHRVTVTDALVAHAGHSLMFGLCAAIQDVHAAMPVSSILLTSEAADVPGLRRMILQQVAVPVDALPAGAAALGLARTWSSLYDRTDGDGVAHHRSRRGARGDSGPRSTAPAGDLTETPAATEPAPAPTHVLFGHRAHALSEGPVVLARDPRTGAVRLNADDGVARIVAAADGVRLEVERDQSVLLDGVEIDGTRPLHVGAEVSLADAAEVLRLIALH